MSAVKDNTRLYRGQGQVFLAKRECGKPAGLEFIGNVSELMLNPQTEKIEHTESQTGNNSVDKVIERGLKVELDMTICSMASENLARMIFGEVTTNPIATITDEPKISYLGKNFILDNINIQSITSITTAAGTPLVAGTDYEIVDIAAGMVCILDTTTVVVDGDEILVSYEAGEHEVVSAFSVTNTEYWLRFNGLNTAENNNPVVIDCFKTRFAPTSDLPIINDDDFAEYKQSGDVLFDACQPVGSAMGRYFSVRQLSGGTSNECCD